jgi:UDP-N-acetylglucosamine 2-epimerase (hydrolysing)
LKKIVFLTGTRADFGKIKSVIKLLRLKRFNVKIFVTGMHLNRIFGYTYNEIKKSFPESILYKFNNNVNSNKLDLIIAKTIKGFSKFLDKECPDLVIIHGDRSEALAGAISASFKGILVGHIEGGEISGNIDEHIRHSISKLSHIHFVSNNLAKKRLSKMGEIKSKIFTCGSPDIDVMLSNKLPSISMAKKRYNINFDEYLILLYHPETQNINKIVYDTKNLVKAIITSKKKFIVIYPNNDFGFKEIIEIYKKSFRKNSNFKIISSLRFEYFLTFLKNAKMIIGNSSAGVREAPIYGVPSLNLGNRQKYRARSKSIFDRSFSKKEIISIINKKKNKRFKANKLFGEGDSAQKIVKYLQDKKLWKTSKQKYLKII